MKKIISVLLAVLMTAFLCSCGKKALDSRAVRVWTQNSIYQHIKTPV